MPCRSSMPPNRWPRDDCQRKLSERKRRAAGAVRLRPFGFQDPFSADAKGKSSACSSAWCLAGQRTGRRVGGIFNPAIHSRRREAIYGRNERLSETGICLVGRTQRERISIRSGCAHTCNFRAEQSFCAGGPVGHFEIFAWPRLFAFTVHL